MKLRVIFQRRREVVELSGDAKTLNDFRAAVCRKFGFARSDFDVSLNGRDILNDSIEQLAHLGVVSGDLIYILPKTNEQPSVSTSQGTPGISGVSARDTYGPEQRTDSIRDQESQECSSAAGSEELDYSLAQYGTSQGTEQQCQQAGLLQVCRSHILCREGISDVLEQLFTRMKISTLHKAVWIVIHVLMIETGYICASEGDSGDEEANDLSKIVPPSDWDKGNLIKIKYTHPSCVGLRCSLTFTSLGPYIMVHGLADSVQNSEVFQCRLQPTDFVRGNVDLKSSGASSVYYNLHRLSRQFKDQVAYPLLSFMRAALGLPQLYGLMALPTEVKLMILRNLPVQCVLNISASCHELHTLCNDPSLWEHLVLRDFGQRAKEQHRSWRMEYIHLYKQKKILEQQHNQITLPPIELFPPGHGIGSQPFRGGIFPPGIIGGHNDLFPNLPFVPGGLNPPPGYQPAPGLPRPRFDPFGPLPDNSHMPGSLRGRRPGRPGNFQPRFF